MIKLFDKKDKEFIKQSVDFTKWCIKDAEFEILYILALYVTAGYLWIK